MTRRLMDSLLHLSAPPLTLIDTRSGFYKNCRSVRNRGGKICQSCPFREWIEAAERAAKGAK